MQEMEISVARLREAWMTYRDLTRTWGQEPDDNDGTDFDVFVKSAGIMDSDLNDMIEDGAVWVYDGRDMEEHDWLERDSFLEGFMIGAQWMANKFRGDFPESKPSDYA